MKSLPDGEGTFVLKLPECNKLQAKIAPGERGTLALNPFRNNGLEYEITPRGGRGRGVPYRPLTATTTGSVFGG